MAMIDDLRSKYNLKNLSNAVYDSLMVIKDNYYGISNKY